MECSLENRIRDIMTEILKITDSTNPVEIFTKIAKCDCVRTHGPEHHFIDGACVLCAYRNAGGDIDLDKLLPLLAERAQKMPGGMCGHWGVCGAVTSVGAALALIDETNGLSTDGSWGKHMEYTAIASAEIGKTAGPRCCKRDGYIALLCAAQFIGKEKGIKLDTNKCRCSFSDLNKQCIKGACPFYPI